MIWKLILFLNIILCVMFVPFSMTNAAVTISDYVGTPWTITGKNLYGISSPCGVRLAWGFKNVRDWNGYYYTYPEYNQEVDVSIYRASNLQYQPISPLESKWSGHSYAAYPGLNIQGNAISAQMNSSMQIIFSGKIKASSIAGTLDTGGFPLCYYTNQYGDNMSYLCDSQYTDDNRAYNSGDNGFMFTDMNAVPGNTYYYVIVDNNTQAVIAGTSAYTRVKFERPTLTFDDTEDQFSLSGHSDYAILSNYCPFIHTPGSGGSFVPPEYIAPPGPSNNYYGGYAYNYDTISLSAYSMGSGLGGQVGDLSCTQDKYAFAVSRGTTYQSGIQNGYSVYYGQDAFSRTYGQITTQYSGLTAARLSDTYGVSQYNQGKFDMTKVGATSYNFYRMVCDAGDPAVYHTGCTLDKIENQLEISIQEVHDDLFEVTFDNSNYAPPTDKQHFGYYISSVYGGVESFPVALGSVSWLQYYEEEFDGQIYSWWNGDGKLPLCYEQCLDPDTIDPNTPISLTSLFSGKKLHWDSLNNKLIQEDTNESDLNQKWYIRSSGDSNFARLISANNGKALSTNGFLDWSWENWLSGDFFNEWAGTLGWELGYFPGINNYEWNETDWAIGNSVTQENISDDDGQKWCIIKHNYEFTDTYTLINKSTQSTLRPIISSQSGYAEPSINSGAQVWLDLNTYNSTSYLGGPSGYPVSASEGSEGRWLLPEISEFQSCSVPGGTTIPHGSSTTYYISDAINGDCDDSSNKEIRTCTNGTLSGTATSNSCTEYCVINGQNVYSGNSVSYYKNSTASTNEDCQSTNNKITYSCEDNGIIQPTVDSDYSKLYCTYSNVLEPKTLNLSRLVPNIVNLGQQCRGKVDTNEISTYGLNLATSTCDIYQVLNDNTPSNTKYSSGDPKSTTLTDWPLVDPGKDYRIICKDTAIPNYTTAISKTLKCMLNPEVKEI